RPDGPATIDGFVRHADAVTLGRALAARATGQISADVAVQGGRPLFALLAEGATTSRSSTVPLALSSTLHLGLIALAVFIATFNLAPRAATIADDRPDPMRLVFLATPGPGGGGGGGGLQQKAPPPTGMPDRRP